MKAKIKKTLFKNVRERCFSSKARTETLVKAEGKEAFLKARTKTWFKEKMKRCYSKAGTETRFTVGGKEAVFRKLERRF